MRLTEHNQLSEVRLQRANERVVPHTVYMSQGRAPFTCGKSAALSKDHRLRLAHSAPQWSNFPSESCWKH